MKNIEEYLKHKICLLIIVNIRLILGGTYALGRLLAWLVGLEYSHGLAPGFSCVHGRLLNLSMLEDMKSEHTEVKIQYKIC